MKLVSRLVRAPARSGKIELRDDKGRTVATVDAQQTEFRLDLRSNEVDLRPLTGLPDLSSIEIVNDMLQHLDRVVLTETPLSYRLPEGVESMRVILPSNLPNLRHLRFTSDVKNLEVMPTFERLETLDTGGGRWESLGWLPSLRGLTALNIALAADCDLSPLAHLDALSTLSLDSLRSVDLGPVAGLKQLTDLAIDRPGKSVRCLKELLRLIRLCLTEFQEKDLTIVSGMKDLSELRVAGGIVSLAGIAGPTHLRVLALQRSLITDESLKQLVVAQELRSLSLSQARRITDISPLSSLTQLRDLDLSDFSQPLQSIAPLRQCSNLVSVNLLGTHILDQDLSPLYDLPNLERVRAFVYTQRQLEEGCARMGPNAATLVLSRPPRNYIQRGDVRIWTPQAGLNMYRIDQNIADLIKVESQQSAETRVRQAMESRRPQLAGQIEYDSEANAFVARSPSRAAVLALADTILDLRSRGSSDG